MANSVKFPPSHKEEVQTNSEAIKGGPLGISNQESQQDLFLFHEEISKDKFFSTCDLTLLFFFFFFWRDSVIENWIDLTHLILILSPQVQKTFSQPYVC